MGRWYARSAYPAVLGGRSTLTLDRKSRAPVILAILISLLIAAAVLLFGRGISRSVRIAIVVVILLIGIGVTLLPLLVGDQAPPGSTTVNLGGK